MQILALLLTPFLAIAYGITVFIGLILGSIAYGINSLFKGIV